MRSGLIGAIIVLILTLGIGPAEAARAEWRILQTLRFENEPLDMLVENRTRRVYVLSDAGEILVYGFNGGMKGKINVGSDVVQIKAGPSDGMLFLLRRKGRAIQSITIDVTEEIKINGSPLKGEKDAPVTIAVFSDFQ